MKEGTEQIRKVSMQKHPSKKKQDWQDEDNNYKRAREVVLTVEQRETINQERRRHQQLNCDNPLHL